MHGICLMLGDQILQCYYFVLQVNESDFLLFDNVIHVDAGDNNLPFCKLISPFTK